MLLLQFCKWDLEHTKISFYHTVKCSWCLLFFEKTFILHNITSRTASASTSKCPKWQSYIRTHYFHFFLFHYTSTHTHTHTYTHRNVQKNKTMCRCETPNVWGSTPSDVYISRHYEKPLRAARKKLSFLWKSWTEVN